jgi:membrane protease YdiL (CAAX protease family)
VDVERVPGPSVEAGRIGARLNFKRIGPFLALTFGLSWGFEGLVALTIGQLAYLETGLHPLGMFFPAFSALVLQIFFFRDSALYFRTYREKPRWIVYSFLLLTVLMVPVTLLALTTQLDPRIWQGLGAILVMLWTLVVLNVYGQSSAESLERAGLQLGNTALGVRFIAGVTLFLLSQAALNWLFGLGTFPGIQERVGGVPVPEGLYPIALAALFLISVVGTPLSGLATVFGEEYGWRGFFLSELRALGPRAGVLVVGLVWGIWHFPIILSGVHTYPASWTGLLLALIFFVLAGFAFGYAILKAQSIWVAAFMHGVMNSVYAFVVNYLMRPEDRVFSFGLGVFGLACLAAVALVILRDPIWRRNADGSHR